jgi:hypothetical protein
MLRKTIFVNSGGTEVLIVAQGGAYHTALALDYNILGRAKYLMRHTHRESDVGSDAQRPVERKQNPARRDIAGLPGNLVLTRRQHHRQRQRKTDGAANLLPAG